MLGGCVAINNSLARMGAPLMQDVVLIAILNGYEAALLGLAWHLVHRRGLIHDGVMLLALEAFFLVDVVFVAAEFVTSNGALGMGLGAVLFLVAIVKLCFMAKIAGFSVRDARFSVVVIQLGALFALPMVFRHFDDGDLSPHFFYFAWWMAGILVPVCLTISQRRSCSPVHAWGNGIVRLLCVLPWFSFLLHLGNLHWVYNVTFYRAEAAPGLLGLACALRHVRPTGFVGQRDLGVLKILLPMAAVCVSLDNPGPLCFAVGGQGRYRFTPTDLAVAGAYLSYVYCFAGRYAMQFVAAGAAACLAHIFGPSAQQAGDWIFRAWTRVSDAVWSLVPKTAMHAGVAAIAAAFGFLGLGALVSLRRHEAVMQSDPPKIAGS